VAIKAAHKRTRESYGARRLQPELAEDGFVAGRDRIARLRREMGLRCRQKRKFKATTNSKHSLPVAENLLDQTFTPSAPNEVWVTDITYIPTGEGWQLHDVGKTGGNQPANISVIYRRSSSPVLRDRNRIKGAEILCL